MLPQFVPLDFVNELRKHAAQLVEKSKYDEAVAVTTGSTDKVGQYFLTSGNEGTLTSYFFSFFAYRIAVRLFFERNVLGSAQPHHNSINKIGHGVDLSYFFFIYPILLS